MSGNQFVLIACPHTPDPCRPVVFGSSTALTTLKFPHNPSNLFASNKASLLKSSFHTWLYFFLTSHWYWIPAVFFWSYLKSIPHLSELWQRCLLYMDKDAQQTAHLRIEFGYILNFSAWQTHKPVRSRGILLSKASFHLDWVFLLLTESKHLNPFWQDMGSRQGWKTWACWDFLLSIVSLSVWELHWFVTNLERRVAETLILEVTCCG